jgi:hypothetical protein
MADPEASGNLDILRRCYFTTEYINTKYISPLQQHIIKIKSITSKKDKKKRKTKPCTSSPYVLQVYNQSLTDLIQTQPS